MKEVTTVDTQTSVVTTPGRPVTIVKTSAAETLRQTVVDHAETFSVTPGRGLKALGWRFYQDPSASDSSPILITAGTRVQVPIFDGGPFAQGYGVNSDNWLKPATWRFYPDDLGDVFLFRLNITIRPTVNNKSFAVDFDIGTLNHIWNDRVYLTSGAGIAVPKSFEATINAGSGMVRNGGAFYLQPEADLYINKINLLAFKAYSVTG